MSAAEPDIPPEAVEALAHELAGRHREAAATDHDHSLLAFAEVGHRDDWSLRSALVRLAQPEPVRAGALLEVIRRCEGALAPHTRELERHVVACQPSLGPDRVEQAAGTWTVRDDGTRAPDIRLADLARLAGPDPTTLLGLADAYDRASPEAPLDPVERTALPLVQVAARLERLAMALADWAATGPLDPPLDQVDQACLTLTERLDELGVPREGPPPDRRRGEPFVGERRRR